MSEKKNNAIALLGDHSIKMRVFPSIDAVFKEFERKEFKELSDRKRSETVNKTLLKLIQETPEPCFLLSEVLDFVEKVDSEKILEHYTFSSFELWLNQVSGLNFEENYRVRAKIAGKWVERSEYQVLFPIGMGKVYEGTHFVTAHKSPDLDTTIASFWGWLDAFAARVSEGLHVWNLPGGPPPSQIEIDLIFKNLFGPAVFTHLPKTRTSLTLTGNDLMTRKGFLAKLPTDSITTIDHERLAATVVVDEEGFYIGDWRHFDVEGVRQVIIMLSSCLRWFENSLNLHLIGLFSQEKLEAREISPILEKLFGMKLKECEPAHEFSPAQKKQVHDFVSLVLGLENGLEISFEKLISQLSELGEVPLEGPKDILDAMKEAQLFDSKGVLLDERPRIFHFLENAVRKLHEGIVKIRARLERLDIALKTKYDVFGHTPTLVSVRSDVEEIRNKMSSYPYLTVVYPDKDRMYPVGIIPAAELRKNILATVSLRDFCNRDEMTIPAYVDVISVIDHHKSALNTFSAPLAVISDVQSSNTLVADRTFQINSQYSLLGQSSDSIEDQIKELGGKSHSPESDRLLQRLLKLRSIARKKSPFYVHPDREFIEYLHFLYGIIDDTDLLSKMSPFDIECVADLLNRLKSISSGRQVEIVALDDLPKDKNFTKKAAERILRNEDMYSLYRKVYSFREKEVEKNLTLSAQGKTSNLFADTKEQNGCCRIGQTKLFANNFSFFQKNADAIRNDWQKAAQRVSQEKPEIDLHIHMISTIVHADEVYEGRSGKYEHKDELWIWIPDKESAVEHLKRFLNSFQDSPGLKNNPLTVEFLGSNGGELEQIFKESFLEIPRTKHKKDLPIAVLRFNAGSLNSRKAMVSPFLPSLI